MLLPAGQVIDDLAADEVDLEVSIGHRHGQRVHARAKDAAVRIVNHLLMRVVSVESRARSGIGHKRERVRHFARRDREDHLHGIALVNIAAELIDHGGAVDQVADVGDIVGVAIDEEVVEVVAGRSAAVGASACSRAASPARSGDTRWA